MGVWLLPREGLGPALGLIQAQIIDVNRAPIWVLECLPGIGSGRARAIVLHRVRHGPFRSVADLNRIEGFGLATIEALEPHVTCAPGAPGGPGFAPAAPLR